LYAELVKNRSFDFPQNLMGWKTFGNVKVMSDNAPFPNNPTYVALSYSGHSQKYTGIENEGFTGIGFKKERLTRFSVWAKNENPDQEQKIRIEFINSANSIIGQSELIIKEINGNSTNLLFLPVQQKKRPFAYLSGFSGNIADRPCFVVPNRHVEGSQKWPQKRPGPSAV
jgi:hypothetical protein